MNILIKIKNLSHVYNYNKKDQIKALDSINLEIKNGDFVSIIGSNGSGKSTLAKHMNCLLLPTSGDIWVDKMNTKDKNKVWEIRRKVGMVFQNPDNQIIATTVEDDIAFG
ncbi:MAG: ATP-binding cassette domain-containing protein, partial [Candidatus Caldatribacteriota bacterium]|nr:ATP-binding cassette domain-containing protein [Candidatus Caldatribacteriota bacterium]